MLRQQLVRQPPGLAFVVLALGLIRLGAASCGLWQGEASPCWALQPRADSAAESEKLVSEPLGQTLPTRRDTVLAKLPPSPAPALNIWQTEEPVLSVNCSAKEWRQVSTSLTTPTLLSGEGGAGETPARV